MGEMKWIEIEDVIPGKEETVFLTGKYNGGEYYAVGSLGGGKYATRFMVEFPGGRNATIDATHWCRPVPTGRG